MEIGSIVMLMRAEGSKSRKNLIVDGESSSTVLTEFHPDDSSGDDNVKKDDPLLDPDPIGPDILRDD